MIIRHLFVFILSLLSATSAWANNTLPDHIAGALCVVRADNQIVLVDELITGHLSLPGGTVVAGESPAVAAQRETWEEAGLSVTVRLRLIIPDKRFTTRWTVQILEQWMALFARKQSNIPVVLGSLHPRR